MIRPEDEVRRETENEWKKLHECELEASHVPTAEESLATTTRAETSDLKIGYLMGFGVINTLLSLFMWLRGIVKLRVGSPALRGNSDGSLERLLRGAVTVGIVVVTAFWFPLAVSGILIRCGNLPAGTFPFSGVGFLSSPSRFPQSLQADPKHFSPLKVLSSSPYGFTLS